MSQANSNWSVLARDNHSHHGHHHEHYHYPTQYFCELLENAVQYIQTKHAVDEDDSFSAGLPEDFLHQLKGAIHAGRMYMLALGVVIFYEYLITIDLEVELLWKRVKRCVVFSITFLNRYLTLATYLFIVSGVQYANSDHEFCTGIFSRAPPVLLILCEAMIGIVRLLLIGSLWKNDPRRKMFLGVSTVVYLVQICTAIACALALVGIGPLFGKHQEQFGCFLVFQKGSMPRLAIHWFSCMLFNILICYSVMKKSLAIPLFKNSDYQDLAHILVRDVRMLLIVVVAVHITNLLMLVLFPYWNAVNWAFSNIADVILTSRLLFNLRQALVARTEPDCFESQLPRYYNKELPPLPVRPNNPASIDEPSAGPSHTTKNQDTA